MASQKNGTLYIGVTSDLVKRVYEHKMKLIPGFTAKYNVDQLVYFEVYEDINEAITREKQLKGGSRKKKLELICKDNPEFKDIYNNLI